MFKEAIEQLQRNNEAWKDLATGYLGVAAVAQMMVKSNNELINRLRKYKD